MRETERGGSELSAAVFTLHICDTLCLSHSHSLWGQSLFLFVFFGQALLAFAALKDNQNTR